MRSRACENSSPVEHSQKTSLRPGRIKETLGLISII